MMLSNHYVKYPFLFLLVQKS